MDQIPFIPHYKLLVTYDIRRDMYEGYYQYVLGEFIPELRKLGLYQTWAWHTAYGNYPLRQVEFVSDSLDTIRGVLHDTRWHTLESRLMNYTVNYARKVVRYRIGFQF